MDHARDVLDYWFGKRESDAESLTKRMAFWFPTDGNSEIVALFDREIAARFEPLMQRAQDGQLDAWADSPRRRLALILLFDQFPRNVHRGSARAFATDERALALTLAGMQGAADAALQPLERVFFYMPLQHSESLDVQEESLAAYRRLFDETSGALQRVAANTLKYAQLHHELIRRFGRFPHRNALLGRQSTAGEQALLDEEGMDFGQRPRA